MIVYTEAEFGACLIECGPHHKLQEAGHLGDRTYKWENFSAYYNRVFAYFHEHVRTVKYGDHGQQWIEFWHQYMTWMGDAGELAPGNSIHAAMRGYGRHHDGQ